jgi:lycopene cyclase CruA
MDLDRARDRVREAGGQDLCERLEHLDAVRVNVPAPRPDSLSPPDADTIPDYDVAMAGGGLSLLLAPMLAERGWVSECLVG